MLFNFSSISTYFRYVAKHFNATFYTGNGPEVLTKVLIDICSTKDNHLWTPERCNGFKVYPKEIFYAINYGSSLSSNFDPAKANETLQIISDKPLIHIYSIQSREKQYKVGTNNAYQILAKKNCPLVYGSTEYFR